MTLTAIAIMILSLSFEIIEIFKTIRKRKDSKTEPEEFLEQ
jgi:hypothetical protein